MKAFLVFNTKMEASEAPGGLLLLPDCNPLAPLSGCVAHLGWSAFDGLKAKRFQQLLHPAWHIRGDKKKSQTLCGPSKAHEE
jgi:hypothetical protein